MMRRLFWPLSWVLLLEGFFLNLPLGWMVASSDRLIRLPGV